MSQMGSLQCSIEVQLHVTVGFRQVGSGCVDQQGLVVLQPEVGSVTVALWSLPLELLLGVGLPSLLLLCALLAPCPSQQWEPHPLLLQAGLCAPCPAAP